MALSFDDWREIRILWISSTESVRSIAAKFGISEKAIRKHAASESWGERNSAKVKRAIVSAGSAWSRVRVGPQIGPDGKKITAHDVIEEEALADIDVMDKAAKAARKIIEACHARIEKDTETRELKLLAETVRISVDAYRRARNLDESPIGDSVTIDWGEAVVAK